MDPRFEVGYPGSLYDSKTWEEWKELEDSLEPSTLRDEVRRMRFLTQYKATKDESVLEEFKAWLKTLPSIQRRILAGGYPIYTQEFRPVWDALKDLRKDPTYTSPFSRSPSRNHGPDCGGDIIHNDTGKLEPLGTKRLSIKSKNHGGSCPFSA